MRRLAIIRLFLAAAITLAAFPIAWGWTLLTPMVLSEVNYYWASILVACVAATFMLTRRQGGILAGVRWIRWVVIGVAVCWVSVLGTFAGLSIVPTASFPAFLTVFVVSSIWLPCTAWLAYSGSIPRSKWIALGVMLACIGLFPALVRVDGMTGDLKLELAWRASPRRDFASQQRDAVVQAPVSIGPVGPDDSPQFFGPNRNGTWPSLRLTDWADSPPTEVWRRAVGPGWSSVAVVGGYCFTQEQRGEDECVTCYRLMDGSQVWTHAEKARFNSSMGGDGPRATPTIAAGRCYAVGATGKLNCLDAASGKKIWGADLLQEFGGENLMHGVCNSPLVDGERVFVCPPGEAGPGLVAYHRDTGARLWSAGSQRASYSSPAAWEVGGVKQIVIHNSEGLAGHDPTDGKQLWLFAWTNAEHINASQPVLDAAGPSTALVTTGYGTGAALIRVKRDGPDLWTAEKEWMSPKKSLKTKFTSAVVYEGNAYGLDDGILACVDVVTGKQRWKDGRYQHGQLILAGDRLIVQAESGDLVMVTPNATALKETGRVAVFSDKSWSVPVIAGRYLIVRNDRKMACYELAGR